MTDSYDTPLTVLLTCGHTGPLQEREALTPHRVVPYGGGWAVRAEGTWCAACVANGRAPDGMGWQEAWDEVKRRRRGQPAPA